MAEAILELEAAKDAIDTRIELLDTGLSEIEYDEDETVCQECDEDCVTIEELMKHTKEAHNVILPTVGYYDIANEDTVWMLKDEEKTPEQAEKDSALIKEFSLLSKDQMTEEKERLECIVGYLGDAIDEAQGVSFPGMY